MNDFENGSIDKQLKVVVLGEPSTGKTSLLKKYCNDDFIRQYYPTFGVDFVYKRIQLQTDKVLRIILWDVSGQALTSKMFNCYIFEADVIMLVFDITNGTSFSKLHEWIKAINKILYQKPPNIALIANKCDMEHQRSITFEKQSRFANEYSISSYSVSARTGENVNSTIQKICAESIGLKLSKMEQEAQQNIVKAEIITNQSHTTPTFTNNSSTVCSIQ